MTIFKQLSRLLLICVLTSSGLVVAQDDQFKDTKIETIDLDNGLYMLIGAGGNLGVSVGEDGVFLIDDQFAPLTDRIKAAIAKLSDKPIRFLINTHWHFDHTGGNENLGKEGVVIVAHDNVYKRMGQDNFVKAFNTHVPASPKVALPVVTFNDKVTFHFNGHTIEASHYRNAHTDGDSIIIFKDVNVIHMGDTFFNDSYPFIDADSKGTVDGVIRAVEHVLELADAQTKIIPGHGPLADKKALQAFHDMLVTVRGRMQKLIEQGKTLDEIIALKPNAADYDKTLGQGFFTPTAFLQILYNSMLGDEQTPVPVNMEVSTDPN